MTRWHINESPGCAREGCDQPGSYTMITESTIIGGDPVQSALCADHLSEETGLSITDDGVAWEALPPASVEIMDTGTGILTRVDGGEWKYQP